MNSIEKFFKKVFGPFINGWGRTPVYWVWRKPKNPMDSLLLTYSKNFQPKWNKGGLRLLSKAVYLYMLLVWPLRALFLIYTETRLYGGTLKSREGKGYFKQITEQFHLAMIKKVSPESYYRYGLYDENNRKEAILYLTGSVASAIFAWVNNNASYDYTEDKRKIDSFLIDKGFSSVPMIAFLIDEKFVGPDGNEVDIPDSDFIAKPNVGKNGKGIFRFERINEYTYLGSDSNRYSRSQLKKFLQSLSKQGPYLIQKRLTNHLSIADLTSKGFSTVRVISAISPDNETEVICAVFKMPTGEGVADNLLAGGIVAPVDLETGVLGTAMSNKTLDKKIERHPDSGNLINGRKLPHWAQLTTMVKAAHKLFPEFVFLGWDIGITEDGPVIIETNVVWDVALVQRPLQSPLGRTRFLDIFSEWESVRKV